MEPLIVIDSYLSTKERADSCRSLINQLKQVFVGNKILVINKHKESHGISEDADYYFYYGDGFMVGYPPQNILDTQKYEMPYTYVQTHLGTCENWFPVVGVTDHVGGIYNSFIISCRLAKMLGYQKIFKVEYDTSFNDLEELKKISSDVSSFKNYLFYGTRKEGVWAKPHQYLVDVHMIGYSSDVFDGFDLVKNDDDYWALCEKIGYYGKWIEYVVPSVIEYQRKFSNPDISGHDYPVRVAEMFPNTEFDTINSPGLWGSSWDIVPKVCRVGFVNGEHEADGQMVLFYWGNEDYSIFSVVSVENDAHEEVYKEELTIHPKTWILHNVKVSEPLTVKITTVHQDRTLHHVQRVVPGEMRKLFPRFLYS